MLDEALREQENGCRRRIEPVRLAVASTRPT